MSGLAINQVVRNQVVLNAIVPITTNVAGSPPPRVTAGQMRLSMAAGDLMLFASSVETRVDMTYNTLSAGFLRYTFNGQYVNPADPLDPAGIIARPMGWNIWNDPHYRIDHKHAFWIVPATGVYVVQHVLYGASSAWTGDPDDHIKVPYVEQYAVVLRPIPDPPEDPRWGELTALTDSINAVASQVQDLAERVTNLENPV